LRIENLSQTGVLHNISLVAHRGEITGLAGLMGAGRTELAMSIFGRAYGQKISGEALLHGKPVDVSTIPKAMEAGLAYATEDRKTYGLVLIDHIKQTGAKAIFLETGTNPQLAEQLTRETGIKVVSGLYTHSISDSDGQAPSYIEMIKYDVQAIVTALR